MRENKLYFEEKGEQLLREKGLSKAEFARRMGIRRQNVNQLFTTKNLFVLRKAADVLGVPFELLIGYAHEPNLDECIFLQEEVPLNEIPPFESSKVRDVLQMIKAAGLSELEIEWLKNNL